MTLKLFILSVERFNPQKILRIIIQKNTLYHKKVALTMVFTSRLIKKK